ncbi:exodeoxyribonuclease I [Reinekea marinisedimentorum]|uniref:Exodeoxyribonuclease I n=1 Tax=Reinekea marinisedimentorum TaxID=230495 RepID=A0A4R3IAZ0_9GAMM|nr:exodeoxyribonuclease I [Reinekea marinisedimentorum]TCS41607.1 exodeoxyribonuclease-1 [Reinekea marinisedimentorum]
MSVNPTLLWYDYETWGANPMRDRLAQFAAVRTDMDLNPVGEPVDLLCKPAVDTLIDPEAVTITGLSPLQLSEAGLTEWQFAEQIHEQMSESGTCTVGYNSIRFDDECTRYLFYRNLYDPYAREWKNGNSRWDIMDMVRMTKALRPEGIEWPVKEDGSPSFKLEHLTAANGIAHEQAHDAVSDVKATIAMAKLIKDKQPKLYDYAFSLRQKREVLKHLDTMHHTPHLHFTGKVPALEHCMGIEMPLMIHPDRNNEVIVIDIRKDPRWLLEHNADQLREWLFTATDQLPEGIERPPFKTIHINRSPMVAPMSLLDEPVAERLGINLNDIATHRQWVDQHPDILKLALDIFTASRELTEPTDPEHALYSGFIDDHDRALLNKMQKQKIAKEHWLNETHNLHDSRLPELVESILARHFPDALSDEDLNEWQKRRLHYLTEPDNAQALTPEAALKKAEELLKADPENTALAETQQYLQNFYDYWFVTVRAKFDTNPAEPKPNSDNIHTETEEDSGILSDQLDLF